jgi:aspartate aminotransferase
LGYAYGPAEAIDAMEKFKQYTSLASNAISQLALIRFLSSDLKERYLRDTVIPTYLERRNAMGEYIRRYLPKAKTVKPNGAFYYFVDMKAYLNPIRMSDEQLSEELVQRKKVVVIPGAYFGLNGKQHIRLTFVSEPVHRIEQGLKKLGEFFNEM